MNGGYTACSPIIGAYETEDYISRSWNMKWFGLNVMDKWNICWNTNKILLSCNNQNKWYFKGKKVLVQDISIYILSFNLHHSSTGRGGTVTIPDFHKRMVVHKDIEKQACLHVFN